jgi:hypothetical protein
VPELWIEVGELDNPDDPYADYAAHSATYILWALSGRKYHGVSEITEQYVCPEYDIPANCSWVGHRTYRTADGVFGYIQDGLNHQSLHTRIRLRQQPVRKIVSLSLGGSAIPSGSYFLRNGSDLVVNTGTCNFSLCDAPEVTYKYGVAPPSAGKLAALDLANELVKGYNGEACELPSNVVSIQRQGVSIEMFDPADFLDRGRIGLYSVDLFIAVSNSAKANKPAKVFSPDKPRGYTLR